MKKLLLIKKAFVILLGIVAGSACFLLFLNYALLQTKMNKIISEDSRNEGMIVKLKYKNLYSFNTLVVNVQAVTPPADKFSILRSFFQLAREMAGTNFDTVILAYRSDEKFLLDGKSFVQLGELYGSSKPADLLLFLASNLRHLNGDRLLSGTNTHYASLLEQEIQKENSADQKAAINSIVNNLTQNN